MFSVDFLELYEKPRVIDYVLSLIETLKSISALTVNDNGMAEDANNSKVNEFFPMAQ
jgi:hypothetical protein